MIFRLVKQADSAGTNRAAADQQGGEALKALRRQNLQLFKYNKQQPNFQQIHPVKGDNFYFYSCTLYTEIKISNLKGHGRPCRAHFFAKNEKNRSLQA